MTFRSAHLLVIPALSFSILLTSTAATAQQPASPAAAPTSAATETDAYSLLQTAKTVSVVDLGTDANFPPANINGGRLFKSALLSWGRYTVVPNGAPADVTLQVQGLTRTGWVGATDDTAGYTTYWPYYRLTVIDPKTGDALWDITTPAFRGKSHGQDLAQMSVRNLLSGLKVFEGVALTRKEQKDFNYLDRQRAKGGWIGLGILVGFVGLAAGGALLAHHEFEKSVEDGKQQQRAFCNANNIPLSECAGA